MEPIDDPTYFPGRCARVMIEESGSKKSIGVFGVVHPEVLKNFGVANPTSALELDVEAPGGGVVGAAVRLLTSYGQGARAVQVPGLWRETRGASRRGRAGCTGLRSRRSRCCAPLGAWPLAPSLANGCSAELS